MTAEVVDFTAKKNGAERPDASCISKDPWGREMYLYSITYRMDEADWGAQIWAYSEEDAQKRVAAMQDNLVYNGQIFMLIPA